MDNRKSILLKFVRLLIVWLAVLAAGARLLPIGLIGFGMIIILGMRIP